MLGLFSLSSTASSATSSGSKSCSRSKRRTRWRKCCESMAGSNSKLCLSCLKVYRTQPQQPKFSLRDFLLARTSKGSKLDSLSVPAAWERHMPAEGPWCQVMVSREAPQLSCTANPETPRQWNSMHCMSGQPINFCFGKTHLWTYLLIHLHISTCPSKYLFTVLSAVFISTYTHTM